MSNDPKGELLNIHTYPDPILVKKAVPVTEFNQELKCLCENMLYTMYQAPGIGLAAPQVGQGLRLFVMDIDYKREPVVLPDGSEDFKLSDFNPKIFINPVLKNGAGEIVYQEGCLSVPGIYEDVTRLEKITIDYFDLKGKPQSLDAEGLLAICIQHEFDHLEGIVFIEKLSAFKKNFIKKKLIKNKQKSKNL